MASDEVVQQLPDELKAQMGTEETVTVKGVAEPLPVRRAKPLAPVG